MEELLKLQQQYKMSKQLSILALSIMGILLLLSTFLGFYYTQSFSKRIYVLNKNEQFQALAGDVKQNRPVEIQYHVQRFHELFFGLAPDPKQIASHMQKAAYLGDESIVRLYNDLKEQDFYNQLIQGNVIQSINIDSIAVYTAHYPYQARCFFRLTQDRASNSSEKFIISTCSLVDIPRSINSPNGLFLRNFKITQSTKQYVTKTN